MQVAEVPASAEVPVVEITGFEGSTIIDCPHVGCDNRIYVTNLGEQKCGSCKKKIEVVSY